MLHTYKIYLLTDLLRHVAIIRCNSAAFAAAVAVGMHGDTAVAIKTN